MPNRIEEHRLDAGLENGQRQSKVLRPLTHMDCLDPAVAVQRPVRVEEWRRDGVLQLRQAQSQRGDYERAIAMHGAVPLELAERREGELVGQVALAIPLLIVLVLVQGQRVDAVLVLVLLVIVLNA